MKTLVKGVGISVIISCSVLMCAQVRAAPLDPANPYVTPTDDGNAVDVNVIGTEEGQQDSLVNVIKGAVNRVLAILALIALVILLYGGFLMVTSAGDDDKYNKGFTILRHAAIGLILIGVARFVISIVFRLVNITTSNAGPAGTDA